MDGSQITGAASSYARKYALNGLFLIDDTKDADTDELANQRKNKAKADETGATELEAIENELDQPATTAEKKSIMDYCKTLGYSTDELFAFVGFKPGKDVMTKRIHAKCLEVLMEMEKNNGKK